MNLLSGRRGPLPAIGLTALISLSGCESEPVALTPIEAPAKLQAAEPRVSGAIPSDKNRLPAFEARGVTTTAAVTAPPAVVSGQGGEVTLNFVDTDIREIVRSILGTLLKLNYTIDPSVQGTATLDINSPLPRSALLPTLETLLNQNGATLVQRVIGSFDLSRLRDTKITVSHYPGVAISPGSGRIPPAQCHPVGCGRWRIA